MLTSVRREPPPSVTCPASLRAAVGERLRTGVNETRIETRPICAAWRAARLPGGGPVSVEATSWALNLAAVPAYRGGQPSSACKFVLVGVANHAGPDGVGAFPSVATLVRYTGPSERTVRTCLDRLEATSIIRPCDPDIVAARIKRTDRLPRPTVVSRL
jgi:Helix-turn-helix domain